MKPKLPKRWRRKALGEPPEGCINKTASDEPGDGISAPESASVRQTQAAGEDRRVATHG